MRHIWKVGDIVQNVFKGDFGTLLSPWTGDDVSVMVLTHRGMESWSVQETRLVEKANEAR